MPDGRPNGGAATASPSDLDELARAVRDSAAAVALVDVESLTVLAVSRQMAGAMGGSQPVEGVDLLQFAADAEAARRELAAVRDGRFDAYQANRDVRRVDGQLVHARLWVRGVERELPRRHVLLALDMPNQRVSAPPLEHAVGAFDREHRIATVSAEADGVMRAAAADVIGRHIADVVHPDDLDALLRTLRAAVGNHDGAGNEVRVRGADGEFHPVHVTACPIDGRNRVGFCATRGGTDVATARVAELERHLTRIAREVEAAGLIRAGLQIPDPERMPELAQLTAKQWEVVTRLLRGERVASIARAMFLSPSTVRNYLSEIYRKVGVHSQSELIDRLRADLDD